LPTAAFPIGLAFGMLLMVIGLAVWDERRPSPGLPQAARVVRWAAAALLLIAIPLLWLTGQALHAPTLRLILMAAVAALPVARQGRPLFWRSTIPTLLALALVGSGLFQIVAGAASEHLTPTFVGAALAICGGLAAHVLGEASSALANPDAPPGRGFERLYLLLTLLMSGLALGNLWRQGAIWRGERQERLLWGAWLFWSAAWLSPHARRRLRAGLTAAAALLLIWTALKVN